MRRCALLLLLVAVARCSPGDRQPEFQACVQQCTRSGCVGPECVASCAGGDPSSLGNLQLLRWDCTADCRYRCMQARELAGSLEGLRPLKYDGKWPFERLLGVQEPASVLFSLTNLWAHCRGFTSLRAAMTRTYPLRTLWTGYALLSVNAWVWSSVFHCRDVRATEVLDYCSADALLVYTLFAVVVRARRLLRVHQWLPLAAPLTAALALHLRYMLFTLFDYGLNMKLCVAVGAAQSLVLLSWTQASRHPQRWRLLALVCAAHGASLLELLDFPPLAGLLDAHALWHAATPAVTLGWYAFLAEDCRTFWPPHGEDPKRVN